MRSAHWAEWIIARFTDRSRAASIVGDLLETAPQRGSLWFWLSVVGIVFSLTWRRAIAFVAAIFVGARWRSFAILAFFHAGHPSIRVSPWDASDPLFSVVWFGTVLWMAAPYAAIRYGLRDKFTQLALAFCGLITIAVFYWRIPVVTVACIALALSILIASVQSAQRSRALVALTAALVFGFGGGLLSLYLIGALEGLFYLPLMRSSLGRSIVAPCLALLLEAWTVWITTTTCARMHDRLLRGDQRSTETESST